MSVANSKYNEIWAIMSDSGGCGQDVSFLLVERGTLLRLRRLFSSPTPLLQIQSYFDEHFVGFPPCWTKCCFSWIRDSNLERECKPLEPCCKSGFCSWVACRNKVGGVMADSRFWKKEDQATWCIEVVSEWELPDAWTLVLFVLLWCSFVWSLFCRHPWW